MERRESVNEEFEICQQHDRGEQEKEELTNLLLEQLAHEAAHQQDQERIETDIALAILLQEDARNEEKLSQELLDCELAAQIARQEFEAHQQERGEQVSADVALALTLLAIDEENECFLRSSVQSAQEALQSLLPHQLKAVDYVKEKAKAAHDAMLPLLQKRVSALGFTKKQLDACLDYVREEASIIIHVKEETLSKLTNDTHYRNLFETNKSGGSTNKVARKQWEDAMFGDSYSHPSCKAFDRPKYGCLNTTGDYAGVRRAHQYGKCFLILQQHVRYRSTFFNKDTGGFVATKTLATNDYYAHILHEYDDGDLKAAINVASSARIQGAPSKSSSMYKEVQIHGPVCLAKDVQALSVPGKEKDASEELRNAVWAFQEMTKCTILWQEDLLNPDDGP